MYVSIIFAMFCHSLSIGDKPYFKVCAVKWYCKMLVTYSWFIPRGNDPIPEVYVVLCVNCISFSAIVVLTQLEA